MKTRPIHRGRSGKGEIAIHVRRSKLQRSELQRGSRGAGRDAVTRRSRVAGSTPIKVGVIPAPKTKEPNEAQATQLLRTTPHPLYAHGPHLYGRRARGLHCAVKAVAHEGDGHGLPVADQPKPEGRGCVSCVRVK